MLNEARVSKSMLEHKRTLHESMISKRVFETYSDTRRTPPTVRRRDRSHASSYRCRRAVMGWK